MKFKKLGQFLILGTVTMALLVPFQNCSKSSFTDNSSKSSQDNFDLNGGGEGYEGKLDLFAMYDLNEECSNSTTAQPSVMFYMEQQNGSFQISRGECVPKVDYRDIGGLAVPNSGSLDLTGGSESPDWKAHNRKVLLFDSQLFQVPRDRLQNQLIKKVFRGQLDNVAGQFIDVEIIREGSGIDFFQYNVGPASFSNTGVVPSVVRGDSFVEQTVSDTLVVTGRFSEGLLQASVNTATKMGSIQSTGDVGYSGGLQSSNVALNESDSCDSVDASIGQQCAGGALYAGIFQSSQYMVTPSGCNDSATPTCDGSLDSLTKAWNGNNTNWFDIPEITNVVNDTDPSPPSEYGGYNQPFIVTITNILNGGLHEAAHYCNNMVYGGFSDWYLPSKSELAYLYCHSNSGSHNPSNPQENPDCTNYGGKTSELTGFAPDYYYSSTEQYSGFVWRVSFSTGDVSGNQKDLVKPVRCIRSY